MGKQRLELRASGGEVSGPVGLLRAQGPGADQDGRAANLFLELHGPGDEIRPWRAGHRFQVRKPGRGEHLGARLARPIGDRERFPRRLDRPGHVAEQPPAQARQVLRARARATARPRRRPRARAAGVPRTWVTPRPRAGSGAGVLPRARCPEGGLRSARRPARALCPPPRRRRGGRSPRAHACARRRASSTGVRRRLWPANSAARSGAPRALARCAVSSSSRASSSSGSSVERARWRARTSASSAWAARSSCSDRRASGLIRP